MQKPVSFEVNHKEELQGLHTYPHFYRDVLQRIALYWKGPERTIAWLLLLACLLLSALFAGLEGLFTYWMKDFYDIIQNYRQSAFLPQIGLWAAYVAPLILCFMLKNYINGLLVIRWRRFVTEKYVNLWFSERLYYLLQLLDKSTDNPDQRLSEDLKNFTSQTLILFMHLFDAGMCLCIFLGILWSISGVLHVPLGSFSFDVPGYLVWAALAYAALGTWVTGRTVNKLLPLDFIQEKLEGNFRYVLVRVRENAESIALYKGEDNEKVSLHDAFHLIYNNGLAILKKMLGINMWINFYKNAAVVVPFLIMAPRYFAERLPLGTLIQVANAFGKVQEALSVIISNYVQIVAWKASTLRILTFEKTLQALSETVAASDISIRPASGASGKKEIAIPELTLCTPQGRVIVTVKDLTFPHGQSVLIEGPSGRGKSTFLRAISGIWPFGAGEIVVPGDTFSSFFLPQRPYFPLGTLEAALRYPSLEHMYSRGQVREVLHQVGLGAMEQDLDRMEYWPQVLSGGEQQRLAFARLLLHAPDWAFLDEATSALDEEAEEKMYALVQAQCPGTTLISIGHRQTLKRFHDVTWTLGHPNAPRI